MGKKFKDYYDTDCAILLSEKIKEQIDTFRPEEFIGYITEHLESKTFSERQDLFAEGFRLFIPGDYTDTIKIFSRVLGPELETAEGMFTKGWWLWPVGKYVEINGTENYESSLDFIYELTKRFTGEFAIRPLISYAPRKTMEVLRRWSRDANVHVRRLSSECMRIRLPWAKKSYSAIQEFDLYKEILANLKDAPEKFIQKSVGNNLNDLMKEKPEMAIEIISEWEKDNPGKETLWIIKHGKRSLR